MDLTLGLHVLQSAVFGLVVAAVFYLINGPARPWPVREWLAAAWLLACLCYIILFGVVKL